MHHKWFTGAKTNITINALDRHANSDRRNRAAFIWLGEDGSERIVTYGQLHRMVCRFANGLKSLGVVKGDRVVIYMPLTIEGAVAMLACARLGRDPFRGVCRTRAHRSARPDCRCASEGSDCREMLDSGGGRRWRSKQSSTRQWISWSVSRKLWCIRALGLNSLLLAKSTSTNLLKFSPDCPAEEMDAEDPLFLLYTSGSTGKPKGVVHVHGGYMVGTTYHLESYYDVGDRDIFWCTSDIGWVVGHSYIVYAPLCAGVTTLFREGAIDYPNPGIAWEIVERYGVTKMFTAPTALRMFMRYGESYPAAHDLTSLRVIACAGEPLNPEAWRWAQTHLAGDGKWGYVIDNWWQTELGGPTLGTPPSMAMRPGKVGVAVPGAEADVLDENGKSAPRGSWRATGAQAAFPSHAAHGMARSGALRARLAGDSRVAM